MSGRTGGPPRKYPASAGGNKAPPSPATKAKARPEDDDDDDEYSASASSKSGSETDGGGDFSDVEEGVLSPARKPRKKAKGIMKKKKKRKELRKKKADRKQKLSVAFDLTDENSLIQNNISVDVFFSLRDLMSGKAGADVTRLTADPEFWRKLMPDGTRSGDPTRAVVRFIHVGAKESTCPFPMTYRLNILDGFEREFQSPVKFGNNAGVVFDDIPNANEGKVNYKLTTETRGKLLYKNPHTIDPRVYAKYGNVTLEDIKLGVQLIDDGTVTKKYNIAISGPKTNYVLTSIIHANRKRFAEPPYNLDYAKLVSAAKVNHSIVVLADVYDACFDAALKAMESVKQHQRNMLNIAVILGPPQGGSHQKDFKAFFEQAVAPDMRDYYLDQRYWARLELTLTYALPSEGRV